MELTKFEHPKINKQKAIRRSRKVGQKSLFELPVMDFFSRNILTIMSIPVLTSGCFRNFFDVRNWSTQNPRHSWWVSWRCTASDHCRTSISPLGSKLSDIPWVFFQANLENFMGFYGFILGFLCFFCLPKKSLEKPPGCGQQQSQRAG